MGSEINVWSLRTILEELPECRRMLSRSSAAAAAGEPFRYCAVRTVAHFAFVQSAGTARIISRGNSKRIGRSAMALKIVGAGLGRTGTLSLKLALEQLGFGPCYHMAE